jgi:hypothetical protein
MPLRGESAESIAAYREMRRVEISRYPPPPCSGLLFLRACGEFRARSLGTKKLSIKVPKPHGIR